MSDAGEATQNNPADSNDPKKIARYVEEIELYDRETQKWYARSKRIIKRYKDDRTSGNAVDENAARYNVLWSNTQTLLPSLYARNPKPDIQRRFKDADPVGRVASDILERCVTYFADTDFFYDVQRQCVLDYLLPGRGVLWLRYVPTFKADPNPAQVTDDELENEEAEDKPPAEVIDYEDVVPDYVNLQDFGHNVCRTWEEVWLVWRVVYLDRRELKKRFKRGSEVPLDFGGRNEKGQFTGNKPTKAIIYEAWDKTDKCAVWFHKSMPDALDVRDDPLKLQGFFPCPKPILTNLCNDSLIPTPDYVEYQDQAQELDGLTARIHSITKSIKVAGAYDASVQALGRILSEGVDNTMIPVDSWAMFAEKGGIQGAMSFLPIQEIAEALLQLYEAREQVKKDLHEISGIPDIVRGDSDPQETLGAQQIKTSFATNRISDKQHDIQRFVRETIRIMVDIICNHFQMETIKTISGVRLLTAQEKQMGQQMMAQAQQTGQPPQLPPGITPEDAERLMADPTWEEIEALIRNNALRSFRIDIETDSTIKADQEADKASATEMITAVGGFLKEAAQAGAQQPEMVPVLGQILMFYMRRFPVGKELESSMQQALTKLEKIAANPQPKPDPEMMKVQADAQAKQAKMQGDMQLAQQKMQMDVQLEQQKAQIQAQTEQAKAQAKAAVQQHLNELEDQRRMHEIQAETAMKQMEIEHQGQIELQKAHIQAAASIEVARINAKADDGAAAEARESSGE